MRRPGASSRAGFPAGAAWLPAILIPLTAWFVYAPAFHGKFLWDDDLEIMRNGALRHASGLPLIWSGTTGIDYFPLKTTVQWVEWHLWADHVVGYHLVTVGLHALSALLVWRLLACLGMRRAWLGGLLFAVHPLAVESVAWISELKNTLSLPLLLLAMIGYVEFDDASKGGARSPQRAGLAGGVAQRVGDNALHPYFWSIGCFLAAMLCKSSVVMFPAVLLLYVWWKRARISRRDVWATAPFFAVALLLGGVTVWFQLHRAIGAGHAPVGFLPRAACAGLAAAFYLGKCLMPVGLLPVYPRWTVSPPTLAQFLPWPCFGAVLAWCWARRATWGRHALFGLGSFLLNLLPVLGFVPMAYHHISWVADHLAYLPLVSVVGLIAAALSALPEFQPSVRGAAIGFCLAGVGSALAAEGRAYARNFSSAKSLWTYAVRKNPQSWIVHFYLGGVLMEEGQNGPERAEFAEALRLVPDNADVHEAMGDALVAAHRWQDAIVQYRRVLQLNADAAGVSGKLATILDLHDRIPEAIPCYEDALRLKPDEPALHLALGDALMNAGRLPAAVAQYERAAQLQPDSPGIPYKLAVALHAEGRILEAIPRYQEAVRLRPGDCTIRMNFGVALKRLGRVPEAVAQFAEAVRLSPDNPDFRYNLEAARATLPPRGP